MVPSQQNHLHMSHDIQRLPYGRPSLQVPGLTFTKLDHIEISFFQVGSFNYAIDKMVFRDEFVPAKKDAVKSVLDYDISISALR